MTDYPSNSTATQYQDMDGNLVTLRQLIKLEPEWAHSRIKVQLQEIERYRSALSGILDVTAGRAIHSSYKDIHDIATKALEEVGK